MNAVRTCPSARTVVEEAGRLLRDRGATDEDVARFEGDCYGRMFRILEETCFVPAGTVTIRFDFSAQGSE